MKKAKILLDNNIDAYYFNVPANVKDDFGKKMGHIYEIVLKSMEQLEKETINSIQINEKVLSDIEKVNMDIGFINGLSAVGKSTKMHDEKCKELWSNIKDLKSKDKIKKLIKIK